MIIAVRTIFHIIVSVYISMIMALTLKQPICAILADRFTTTTVPTCDVCQQRLVGGQVLERLPFLLQPSLDVFAWVNAKLQQLMALYNSERHSNDAEYDPKQLQLLMAAELSMLQKFFRSTMQSQPCASIVSTISMGNTDTH